MIVGIDVGGMSVTLYGPTNKESQREKKEADGEDGCIVVYVARHGCPDGVGGILL